MLGLSDDAKTHNFPSDSNFNKEAGRVPIMMRLRSWRLRLLGSKMKFRSCPSPIATNKYINSSNLTKIAERGNTSRVRKYSK